MRTIIAGGRNIKDFALVVNAINCANHAGVYPSVVLSGKAKGADALGEYWAQIHNIPVEAYPAEWDKYGKGAGFKRNAIMATKAEALIALWDGESKGTKHMIDMANVLKLKVIVYKVPKDESHINV